MIGCENLNKCGALHCSPVVAFLLQHVSRWIKHAVVLAGTVGGNHTASVFVDQTWRETEDIVTVGYKVLAKESRQGKSLPSGQ